MGVTQVNGVTINKLTLSKYKELKQNNQLVTNESYVITDIDEQFDKIINYLESEDTSNPIILRNLNSGLYKIYGYFKYYSSYSGISAVDPFAYVIVEKDSTYSYVTIISSNCTERYKISDSNYEDLNDSGWIALNSNISYRKIGKEVFITGTVTQATATGTLPSGYRPTKKNHVFLIAGSGNYYAKARITTAGVISILGHTGSTTTSYEFETSYSTN